MSQELRRLLSHDNLTTRERFRALFDNDPDFVPIYNISLDEQKELAWKRLKKVAEAGLCSVRDFGNNPLNIFTMHEMLGTIDGSLATKFTVHFNLFGGTVFTLKTQRHEKYLNSIDRLEFTGCFCLTELGFGNNAVVMETTAQYDAATKQFVINSPTTLSQKYWITNGSKHAQFAIVFAQLIINQQNEGVHAFLVRIRDQNLKALPEVFIEDMGAKMGLNGVDNARIAFKNLRVPVESLLNRFSDVDQNGKFTSQIKKKRDRFLLVADRLLSGRLCISAMACSASKIGIYNTIKYSLQRKGVGKSGMSDTPIMHYQLQQNAIIPLLSRLVVLSLGFNFVKEKYAELHDKKDNSELVRLVCSIKPLMTWHSDQIGRICRERCGGQGYLSVNRVGSGPEFAHAGMTAEGDNSVLMQKVTKEILADFQKGKYTLPELSQCPQKQIPSLQSINTLQTLHDLLKFREVHYFQTLSQSLQQKVMTDQKHIFDVWMFEESDNIQKMALSYCERFCMDYCIQLLSGNLPKDQRYFREISDPQNKILIEQTVRLFALKIVESDLPLFLLQNIISQAAAQSLPGEIHKLIKEIDYLKIIDSFDVNEKYTPIATNYEAYNIGENKGEVRARL